MDRRAVCMIIWFLLIAVGAVLAKLCPANWLYNFGYAMGSIAFPFCYIALFDRKDRH